MMTDRQIKSTDHLDSRVTRVETALTAQSEQIRDLGAQMQTLSQRIENGFENIRQSIYSARQTPWSVLVAVGALVLTVTMLIITTIGGIRGETGAKFTEVETQFRGVAKEMQTQVDNNKERSTGVGTELEELRSVINGKWGQEGLKEKIARAEQKLEDHDTYLWPVQQEQARQQAELSVQMGKNTSAIQEAIRALQRPPGQKTIGSLPDLESSEPHARRP